MAPDKSQIETGYNDIRIQRYPTLEEGNDAFPEGEYRVNSFPIKGEDYGMELHHELHNADMVRRFIEKKKATYACAVSSPRSAFRKLQISADNRQKIFWEPSMLAETPYFTPMVICLEKIEHLLDSANDGVHPLWNGMKVIFPKGARLALGPVMKLFDESMHSLLTLVRDDDRSPGQFQVKISDDADFRFIVSCHPDLLTFMKSPGDRNDKRRDLMIHMVTACFYQLKKNYNEEDSEGGWGSKSLEALADDLVKRHKYTDWKDLEFQPEVAATLMYPHQIPSSEKRNE